MRRRKKQLQSSFDLFLDTVCNTFGGVLFIAILIAIQVRHTVERSIQEYDSVEHIAELLQREEDLVVDIEKTTILLETIRKTLSEPFGEIEKQLVFLYSELLDKRNNAVARKSELIRDFVSQTNGNAELSSDLNEIERIKAERLIEELRLTQTIQSLRSNQLSLEQILEQRNTDQQDRVDALEAQNLRLKQQVRDRHNPDKHIREEMLHLPKMQDAGDLRSHYLVLRYNRLYVVGNRVDRHSDFDYSDNYLGTPKRDRGFAINGPDVKDVIRSTFPRSPDTHYIGIFVYGDSADSFHIVRDVIVSEGFKYELIPTQNNTSWRFGTGNRPSGVQ